MGGEVLDRPVGIVYHTSESDIWPLEESFNEKLRDSSQNLLRYLRKNRVYHYLIDRFGQVFRVVEETDKANHAGMSVWSAGQPRLPQPERPDDRRLVRDALGGRAGAADHARAARGGAQPHRLPPAQVVDRSPRCASTHGLASVNSKKHLIGHHLDWARGFPFEAFGLPDQYRRPSPAVALFGFGYDEQFLAVMGEPWPGVRRGRAAARRRGRRGGPDGGRAAPGAERRPTTSGSTSRRGTRKRRRRRPRRRCGGPPSGG